jgi:fructose-1-phosphate kinase PfkB-like protein
VLVSLGPDGAIFVDGAGAAAHAEAAIDDAVNSVGAGDALLAGFLASGADAAALPEAVAWSVAAVRSPVTRMRRVGEADRRAVIVHDRVDRERRPRQ